MQRTLQVERQVFWVCFSPNINTFLVKAYHGYCPTVPSLAEYFISRIRLEPKAMNIPPSRKVWLVVLEQRANRLHLSNFILLPHRQCPLDGRIKNHYEQYFQKVVTQGKISVFYCFVLYKDAYIKEQAMILFYNYCFLIKKKNNNNRVQPMTECCHVNQTMAPSATSSLPLKHHQGW